MIKKVITFFPGGKVEAGETLKDALKREFEEEFGIIVKVGKLIGVGEFINKTNHSIDFFFKIISYTGNIEFKEKDKHTILSGFKWVNLKDINEIDFRPAESKGLIKTKSKFNYLGKYES